MDGSTTATYFQVSYRHVILYLGRCDGTAATATTWAAEYHYDNVYYGVETLARKTYDICEAAHVDQADALFEAAWDCTPARNCQQESKVDVWTPQYCPQ